MYLMMKVRMWLNCHPCNRMLISLQFVVYLLPSSFHVSIFQILAEKVQLKNRWLRDSSPLLHNTHVRGCLAHLCFFFHELDILMKTKIHDESAASQVNLAFFYSLSIHISEDPSRARPFKPTNQ